jgi:hypothetical protein
MIGLAGIISAVVGMVSGSVPKLINMAESRQDHMQSLELLRVQNELQLTIMEREKAERTDATTARLVVEEMQAMREQMLTLTQPRFHVTGTQWLDTFNAFIRPTTTAILLAMFLLGLIAYWFGIGSVNPEFGGQLGALFVVAVEAILGYFFGYRGVVKPPAWLAR